MQPEFIEEERNNHVFQSKYELSTSLDIEDI